MYHFVLRGVLRLTATVILLLIGNLRGTEAKIYVLSQETNETVRIIDDKNIRAMSVAIQGYVILANPPSACSVIDPPPNITNASNSEPGNAFSISLMKHWILLTTMNANDCDMTTKAKHAYRAGYSALIVQSMGSNSSDGIYWYMMKFPVKRHSMINKVIVGEYDGDLLKYNYSFPKKYYIRFEEDYFYQYICYSVIGCIFVLLVFLLFIFWVQICCTIMRIAPRFIRYRMENLRQSWEKKLSKGMVDLIPIKTWNTEYQFQVCAICQEDFEVNDELRLLPCRHGFHVPCIDPWLLHRSRRCPNCMQKIVVTKTAERKVIGVQCYSDSCDFNGDSYLELDEDDPGVELLGASSVRSQQEEPEIEKLDDSKIKKEQKEEGSVDWQLGWFLGGFKFVTSSQESMAVSPVSHAPNSSLNTVVSKTERSIELKDLSRSQSSKLPYTCSSFSLKNMYQYGEGYSNHLMTPGTTTLDLQLHRNKDSKNSDATTISESLPRDEVSCPGRLNLEGISDSDLNKYDENDDDAATIRPDFDDYYDYEDYEDDVFDESTSML